MILSRSRRGWLIWLVVVSVIVALRISWVLLDRSRPLAVRQPPRPVEKDYLVAIPKFHATDLGSVRKLIGTTLWVKAGYRAEYFPILAGQKNPPALVAVTFEPMERIVVQDFKERAIPKEQDREVLLLFQKESRSYATVIGFFLAREQQYQMRLDDLFFLEDPHILYSHWPPKIWQKVRAHQLEPQMTFAQVSLSLGDGQLVMMEAGGIQLYQFHRKPGGPPGLTRVRFLDGKVKEYEVSE